MPSVATSVTSQMPLLVLSSRRLSVMEARPAAEFLIRTTALASCVPPPLTTVVGAVGRIHSGKMLLKQVHFTQMRMLPSEVSHADERRNDGE